jgi:hypothetical protein
VEEKGAGGMFEAYWTKWRFEGNMEVSSTRLSLILNFISGSNSC